MIDRFLDADSSNNIKSGHAVTNPERDWKGGDWKGVTQKIKDGYFDNLGVNTIWISSPILSNHKGTVGVGANQTLPDWGSYHAYHPLLSAWTHTFQFQGDPFFAKFNHPPDHPFETAFGTPQELHELINEAHNRGIRILLDFVTNHVHKDSPLYVGPNKKDWFYESQQSCTSNDYWGIDCTFTSDLPDIAYSSKEARDMMTAHAAWLVHELNIDGFRVDALKHMDMQFTIDLSTVMKAETETTGLVTYMVGETFSFNQGQLMDFVGPDKIHGQFDFLFYAATQNILNNGNLANIKKYVEGDLAYYKNRWPGAIMSNFIDNHDVVRFNTGGKHFETRIALAVLLTSQQFPMIWQGTEYGLEQIPGQDMDPGNRAMMQFTGLRSDQQQTLQFAQSIGSLRKDYIALRRGKRTTLQWEDERFWVFKLEYGNETVFVAINATGGNKTANNITSGYTDKTGSCSGTTVPSGKACVFAQK
jgi:glycosidase